MIALVAGALIAAAPVQISVNDAPLAATAVERNGRVLVPFRSIFSALGATVAYRADGHRVSAHRGGANIVLSAGSRDATLNGFPVKLDVAPQILDERVFVPLRFVAQALGARVTYDAADRMVFVRDPLAVRPIGAVPAQAVQNTPVPTYPTSPPVPYVVGQSYPMYGGVGFNLYVPSAYRGNVFFPGDRVRFVLEAPPGGTAFLRICGFGNLPFVNPPGTTQYFTSFVVPDRFRNRDCNAIAYYTGALGAQQTIELPHLIYFAAPTPAPTPRPTATPTPDARRSTEPVFRRTPPPGKPGKRGL